MAGAGGERTSDADPQDGAGTTEIDRIATDFAEIPFADHDARKLALAYLRLREALERIAEQQPKTLAMIERNGFAFRSIGREPGNWQHLAFSIYADLCEVDVIARSALDPAPERSGDG